MSFQNAIMYSRVVPMPGNTKDNAPLYDESKDACNPDNFKNEDFYEEIIIKAK